jgi:hypothetical protein
LQRRSAPTAPRVAAAGIEKISLKTTFFSSLLEHDPEKACPGLDPGRKPVFGKDHAPTQYLDHDPIQFDRIMV